MAQVKSSAYLLDTHALAYWLLEPAKLGKLAAKIISDPAHFIHIPTVVLLELQYLIEIGRIDAIIQDIIAEINETPHFSITPFDLSALSEGVQLSNTRDPFDRMILATALAYDWPVITKDRWMKDQLKKRAVW